MAVTRSHLCKQRAGTPVKSKKELPHSLLNVVRNRPGAAISKQPRSSQRTRRPSAQLQEELENAICRAASAKEKEGKAPRFLFVPFPDVKDIADETHIAIDASNISNRFLTRYPMYNARNMAMIQRELGKGFASHGMTSTKPYCKIPILHQGVVTMQHLSHTFNRDVTFKSWKWLQDKLEEVSNRPKCPLVSKLYNEQTRKPASHPRNKTQQHALLTDPNTPCIIYLHWTIDPGPPTTDLALIHAQIHALQTLHPNKTIRAFPSLSETTSEIFKIPDIRTLDFIASTSPFKYAYRPTTCFTHACPTHNKSTCPLRGQKRIIMKRTHSCSGSHVELIPGDAALPRHRSPPFTDTATTTTTTKPQPQTPSAASPIYFAQSYEPSFSQHGEYRIFITTHPSTSPAAIRGREGKILHTVITEWVDRQDPGAMYARVATAQDFHVHSHSHAHSHPHSQSHSHPKSHSHPHRHTHSQSHTHSHPHANPQHDSDTEASISLSCLHAYALYIYSRLRSCEKWREQFESLEMGVRLDVGVGVRRGRTKDDDEKDEDYEGEGRRFFVNEITRFYGADYFSQHTLGAPQQEVCWGFAEAVGGYFA